ncbi:hypothetical protein [Pseudomonas sp. D2002]|uniref:hypothetical protein n=1 Tax=Pseudomonas sp. D2002 TaxID=2726980 RepID=UPI0015A46F90|nr:hypothetical protein [Pseudomonas sp. D2002]NWA86444.1 hypothetical protein [Pseudomonas sp. D2002]
MQRIMFATKKSQNHLVGELLYRNAEYSIDFLPTSKSEIASASGQLGRSSLTMGTLQLEVSIETGRVLYPWGLFPLMHCKQTKLTMRPLINGEIYVDITQLVLASGVAYAIPGADQWELLRDLDTGWICVGNADMSENVVLIEFSTDAVMSFKEEKFIALWLHPSMET